MVLHKSEILTVDRWQEKTEKEWHEWTQIIDDARHGVFKSLATETLHLAFLIGNSYCIQES